MSRELVLPLTPRAQLICTYVENDP